jgi:hypothetical protein
MPYGTKQDVMATRFSPARSDDSSGIVLTFCAVIQGEAEDRKTGTRGIKKHAAD